MPCRNSVKLGDLLGSFCCIEWRRLPDDKMARVSLDCNVRCFLVLIVEHSQMSSERMLVSPFRERYSVLLITEYI